MSEQPIRLRTLLRSRLGQWSLALFLGAVTLLSAIGLLATSGWFISAAALAGLATVAAYGFDYFRPAAIIRFFAIVRTAGRYAERLASHNAALALLKDLRTRLFARVAGQRRLTPAARSAIASTVVASKPSRAKSTSAASSSAWRVVRLCRSRRPGEVGAEVTGLSPRTWRPGPASPRSAPRRSRRHRCA